MAETQYTPFQHEPDAVPVRLIVHRVKPTPGFSTGPVRHPTASTPSSPTARATPWTWRPTIAATPRSRTPSATSSTGVGLNHLPSGRFPANAAWLAVQVLAHNLARWTGRIGMVRATGNHQDPAPALLSPWRDASPAQSPPASPCTCPRTGPGKTSSTPHWTRLRALPLPS